LAGRAHPGQLPDLDRSEYLAALVLAIGIVVAGFFPAPLLALSAASVQEISRLFGG
jgi:NADH:ubiquinone oxidoreductase subunit 4 (subunit M)